MISATISGGFFLLVFSFTSTLTIGAILGGFLIREIPINYYKRMGKSSVRSFTDTIRFFATVLRIDLFTHENFWSHSVSLCPGMW